MREKRLLERARTEDRALTFDDVRLRSGYSEHLPSEVDTSSYFSRKVGLKVPIVSAAMDSVTTYKMARELAILGGLGVIHKAMSPEEQASQVGRVKHYVNGRIDAPITVYADQPIGDVVRMRKAKDYGFSSFPVLDREDRLVGILTGNDFEFCDELSQTVREVMTTSVITAGPNTSFDEAYALMKEKKIKCLPLVLDNRIQGLYTLKDMKRLRTQNGLGYNVDVRGQLRVGAAIGVGDDALQRAELLVAKNVDVLVIDSAHADSRNVYETLKKVKSRYGSTDVVVGNVSIGGSAKRLVDAGADGVKVGQGPGSICTTRIVAGIGRPQLSAIYECVKATEGSGVPICGDGGFRNSGDVTIGIAGGAHSIMLGSMLGGTDEAPGNVVYVDGRAWKYYRGMGSLGAMEDHQAAKVHYGQGEKDVSKLVPEGVETRIQYKGKLENVVFQIMGGLRSGMGYVGAASIEELREKGEFDEMTQAGITESHPHDGVIIREAPNYGGRS